MFILGQSLAPRVIPDSKVFPAGTSLWKVPYYNTLTVNIQGSDGSAGTAASCSYAGEGQCSYSAGSPGGSGSQSTFGVYSGTTLTAAGGSGGAAGSGTCSFIGGDPPACDWTGGSPGGGAGGGGSSSTQTWKIDDPGAPVPGQSITVENNASANASWS